MASRPVDRTDEWLEFAGKAILAVLGLAALGALVVGLWRWVL